MLWFDFVSRINQLNSEQGELFNEDTTVLTCCGCPVDDIDVDEDGDVVIVKDASCDDDDDTEEESRSSN